MTNRDPLWARAALWLLFAAYAAEALFFVYWGRPFLDEGVYLAAGGRVYAGWLPYRDFPFSQGPTIAYVVGLFSEIFGSGLLVGRYVSLAACLATGLAAMTLGRRLAGPLAGAVSLVLLMLNLPAMWIGVTVTTQALSTPLVVMAVLFLTSKHTSAIGWAIAPSLLLWSTCIRLTNGLALAVVLIWTAAALARSPRTLLRVTSLLAAQAFALTAPLWLAPRAAYFHILESPLTRSTRGGFQYESLLDRIQGSTGYFSVPETDYFPILPLAGVVLLHLGWRFWRGWRPDGSLPLRDALTGRLALIGFAALVFVPHFALSSGFPSYFATSSILLCIAIASAAPALFGFSTSAATRHPLLRAGAAVAATALLGVSIVDASRERSTYLNLARGGFPHFQQTGRDLSALLGPDCTMVTFQTHLAIEAGCRLLPGLEYSMFSYFTDLADADAESYGVLTPQRLDERIREFRPEAIAVSRRLVGRLRGAPGPSDEHALDFLESVRGNYTLHSKFPVASGLRLPMATGQERMLLFVRNDLTIQ